jgi:oligopeptidase B
VQRLSFLGDVGDPILELHEDIRTMVETQTIPRTQILVDPHAHAETLTLVQSSETRRTRDFHVAFVTLVQDSGRNRTLWQVPHAQPNPPQIPHEHVRVSGSVLDPFHWLSNRDDPRTIEHLEAENRHTAEWFSAHEGLVEEVFEEIKSRVQETDESVPVFKDGWWYVSRTVEGLSYAIHCRGRTRETATEIVLLDENELSRGHEYFALGAFDVSPNSRLLAWSYDVDGGEHYTLRVRDLETGQDLEDTIPDTSAAGTAWSADSSTVFYVTQDEQERPNAVWRHRLGTPPSTDVRVHLENDERFFVGVDLTRSGEWIVISADSKTSSETHLVSSHEPESPPVLVRPRTSDLEYHVDHWGDSFVILTNENAPDFRVAIAPQDDPSSWSEFLPHVPGQRITRADCFADHLVVHEWTLAQPRLRVVFRDRSELVVHVSDEPHDVEVDSNPEWATSTLRYATESLTSPPSVWEIDISTRQQTLLKRTPTPNVDLDLYESLRFWAESSDGTKIPYDLIRLRSPSAEIGSPTNPSVAPPCLVYAYGSYEISIPPWFSVARLSLVDRGWNWVLAHPRGGGELGRQWYFDGKLLAKRNTFDDVNAVAADVIAQGLGDPSRLAVRGGSAGGLMVGACLNSRPDLWNAAIAEVPFVDVVTTMSDPSLPLTVTEWEEWGDPRTEPFASYIASYSPYDNLTTRDYPAIMATAGLNDPRVSYHEPAKWIARIRQLRTNDRPLVLRTEMGAGHGGPSGRYDRWREEAQALAFLIVTARR